MTEEQRRRRVLTFVLFRWDGRELDREEEECCFVKEVVTDDTQQ